MTVAELKRALAAVPELPLTVLWPDGDPIEASFHVTEVGRVQKDFVDCGGTVRRTVTCLLQTWVGEDTEHRITADRYGDLDRALFKEMMEWIGQPFTALRLPTRLARRRYSTPRSIA